MEYPKVESLWTIGNDGLTARREGIKWAEDLPSGANIRIAERRYEHMVSFIYMNTEYATREECLHKSCSMAE